MNRIYLDYAATTPIDKEVKKAMRPYFSERFGNPNSLYYFGQQARKAVDESREKIAKSIGADFREVIFTGSATEANNLVLRGAVSALIENVKIKNQNDNLKLKNNSSKANTEIFHFDIYTLNFRPRVIISNIEHESILETCRDLEEAGIEVVRLPVDKNGIVNLKKLKEALNENTILVSVMYANNETGIMQPLFEIRKIIDDFKKRNFQFDPNGELLKATTISNFQSSSNKKPIHQFTNSPIYPLFHTDAVQAFQFLNCNVNDLGVDLMTLSAHKIYGPKGVGALYVRNLQLTTYNLQPLITGGGQEFGLRSGTENTAAIVGFAKAIELADKNREKEYKRISELKKYFWRQLKKIYPSAQINGALQIADSSSFNPQKRLAISDKRLAFLPNILNIYFPNQKAEELLIKLDLNGVAVSSGSACAAFSSKPSHTLKALGYNEKRINSSLRFSFGKFTTKGDLDAALKMIKIVLKNNK